MSNSPSGPYKSRIVRGVVQQARRLLDRSQTTIRRAQVLASWSAQILLYPFYAAFQSGRLLGAAVSGSEPETPPPVAPVSPPPIAVWQAEPTLMAETPLVRVLESVQALELPAGYAVVVPEPTVIQAIATLLDSRALVLVTNHNQLLLIPDPEQQHWLQQRVVYEIASYYREQRSRSLPMQRAIAAFRKVGQVIQRWRGAGVESPRLPSAAVVPSDRSVQQCLQAVQLWLIQPTPPALQWAEALPQFAPTDRLALPAGDVTGLAIAAIPDASLVATTDAAISPSAPPRTTIQGLASRLDSRQLALVSVENDVLDILTPEQQQHLQQRIAWEVADYWRIQRVQALPPPTLSVRLAGTAAQVPLPPALLPAAQLVQRFVAWMQSGSVAIATNLFHEVPAPVPSLQPPSTAPADLLGVDRPALAPSAFPTPTRPLPWVTVWSNWLASLGLAAIAPLPSRSSTLQSTSSGLGAIVRRRSRAIQSSAPTVPVRSGTNSAITVSPQNQPTESIPIARPSVAPDGDGTTIDTHATAIGYEQSWFERVMGWLDQCFLWVETAIAQVWHRITHDE